MRWLWGWISWARWLVRPYDEPVYDENYPWQELEE